MIGLARRLAVPLRHYTAGVRYCGDFHGQTATGSPLHAAINVEGLIKILTELPPGITELACHPGLGDDSGSAYGKEREQEVRVLRDPRVRAAIAAGEIKLCPFDDDALRGSTLVS